MQTFIKKITLFTAMAATFGGLSSFSDAPGGDKWEIYLNKKLVAEQYVTQVSSSVKYINLTPDNYNTTIDVYYSHCGRQGTNRSITLKDTKNKFVKKWVFGDAGGKMMSWKAKEIMDLLKGERSTMKLYYSSRELPEERLLASVTSKTNGYASAR